MAVGEIRARLSDRPMMMAGMIGSNRGWVEAPYVACPAGAEDLASNLKWVEAGRCAIGANDNANGYFRHLNQSPFANAATALHSPTRSTVAEMAQKARASRRHPWLGGAWR